MNNVSNESYSRLTNSLSESHIYAHYKSGIPKQCGDRCITHSEDTEPENRLHLQSEHGMKTIVYPGRYHRVEIESVGLCQSNRRILFIPDGFPVLKVKD